MNNGSENNQVPEAEDYLHPETDQMETLIIEEDGEHYRREQRYYQRSFSGDDWPNRIRAGLIVRLLMVGLVGMCMLVVLFQMTLTVINAFLSVISLFRNPVILRSLASAATTTFRWVLMTLSACVAVISPSIGIMLMLMALVVQDSNSFSAHLKDRLQGYSRW